jgi:hypothetical protein
VPDHPLQTPPPLETEAEALGLVEAALQVEMPCLASDP